ncbi:MAG: ABC transporter permease, partial [Desulfobulbaceae bacterium]|nr:ABC transporter permease [Desulfobulbaceae bacterium]
MSFALTSFKKDIARWRQDPMSIVIWMAIPLLVGGMITALMSGDGIKPHGTLLLVDQDESLISGFVAGAYSAGELGELISVEKTTLEEGTQRINAGEASGFLVIPNGFGAAFLNSEPVTLTLKTNPAQTILPGIITEVTEILLDAGFYVHELFGNEIEVMKGFGDSPPDALVAAMAVGLQNKFEAILPQLYPPTIELTIVEPPESEPGPPLAVLFLPGIIIMAVMFSANGLANDFWREREQGTLRRLVYAPGKL